MNKEYPVGKAQKMVLDALGVQCESFQDADAYFARIGISVSPVRVGRSTEPRITERQDGAFNDFGEGESWGGARVDLESLKQWMVQ
jgi:hypothetical protein